MTNSMRRIDWFYIVCVLLLAAGLRTVGLTFGQPNPADFPSDQIADTLHENTPIHPDEYFYVQRPLRMLLTGERNPGFYENPALLIDINLLAYWVMGEQHRLDWEARADMGARREAPFRLYFFSRVWSMLTGPLMVAAGYATMRRLGGRYAAAVVALLLAASYPLVQHAHYAKSSTLGFAFTALTLWAAFNCLLDRPPRWWMFVLAGASAGLTAGSRYDAAGISIVVFVVGLILLYRERTWRRAGLVLLGYIAFPLFFFFTTPWIYFDREDFFREVLWIVGQYGSATSINPWLSMAYLYRYLAVFAIGLPAAAVAGVGFYLAWRHRRYFSVRGNSWPLVVVILLCYLIPYSYVVLRTRRPADSDHLLSASIPVFVLMVGIGAAWLRRRMPDQPYYGALLAVLIAAPSLVLSVQFSAQMTLPDTRTLMQQWVYENIPRGSHIHLQSSYNVPLDDAYYEWSQTYWTDTPSIARLRDEYGADYVIVSDALYNAFQRSPAMYPAAFRTQMALYRESLDRSLVRVAHIDRPWIIGTEEMVHTATLWHNPGLTLYCVTEAACNRLQNPVAVVVE